MSDVTVTGVVETRAGESRFAVGQRQRRHENRQGLSRTGTTRFAARSGLDSFVRSDGCAGRWKASKQWPESTVKPAAFRWFSLHLPPPQLGRPTSLNFTSYDPELRLIATQVSDQIGEV